MADEKFDAKGNEIKSKTVASKVETKDENPVEEAAPVMTALEIRIATQKAYRDAMAGKKPNETVAQKVV